MQGKEESEKATGDLSSSRLLPDGRTLFVDLQGEQARVGITSLMSGLCEDSWQYFSDDAALKAFYLWQGQAGSEPQGWYRHIATHRYRPNSREELQYVKQPGGLTQSQMIALTLRVCLGPEFYTEGMRDETDFFLPYLPVVTTASWLRVRSNICKHTPACCWYYYLFQHADRHYLIECKHFDDLHRGVMRVWDALMWEE